MTRCEMEERNNISRMNNFLELSNKLIEYLEKEDGTSSYGNLIVLIKVLHDLTKKKSIKKFYVSSH
jgi:hypothetical protein